MTKAADNGRKTPAEISADDFGRAAAKLMRDMPSVPLYPLFTHPTAAMAAATAIGFGLSTQMAGAFFGALQGAFDTAEKLSKAAEADAAAAVMKGDQAAPTEPAPLVVEPKAEAAPVVAKAARKAAPRKPVAAKAPSKTATAKPAPAKAAAATPVAGEPKGASDDLKLISGVGPKLEAVLNSMGYRTFADIAALDDKAIARLETDTGLTGRIGRDDWIGQAKALMGKEG